MGLERGAREEECVRNEVNDVIHAGGPHGEQRTELQVCVDRFKNRRGEKARGQIAAALVAAGTCGGFSVHGFKNGVLIDPKQSNHVAGVGVQPGHGQTERSPGEGEVPALLKVPQVCYLNDKAVKLSTCGAPGHCEAVPRNVRDGEVGHYRLQLLG